ncbi:hypothetical protein [Streptomyces sp. NPDC001292]|uniref:hypothetical protein n=1 Tax=Streptomyces sp. NPDC001292 TaxID=3364558 RepID=UPI0036B2CF45
MTPGSAHRAIAQAGAALAKVWVLHRVPQDSAPGQRLLARLPLPWLRVPRVLGVDDFALKRRHCGDARRMAELAVLCRVQPG